MAAFCTVQSLNQRKLKWQHTVTFVFAYLAWSNADSQRFYANDTVRCYEKSHGRNGRQLKEGVLRGQMYATGLSESVTLLKSTFKLQAISVRYYLLVMEGKMFDVLLIRTLVVLQLICPLSSELKMWNLCASFAMKNVKRVLLLRLRGGALAIYRQLSTGQKADAEQIKQAHITTYATDAFNAYDQFVTWQLCQGETVDEFFAELRRLARLVGGPLPKRWLMCVFISGLP